MRPSVNELDDEPQRRSSCDRSSKLASLRTSMSSREVQRLEAQREANMQRTQAFAMQKRGRTDPVGAASRARWLSSRI